MALEDEVLDVVRRYCEEIRVAYSPDLALREYFYGEDAEDLVYAAAERIGWPRAQVVRSFPFGTYFDPEIPIGLQFPLLSLLALLKWIFGHREVEKSPLTALAFARLLVDLKRTPERSAAEKD